MWSLCSRKSRSAKPVRNCKFQRPRLEVLEDRLAPAVVSWDGGGGDFRWETASNWSSDALPGPADDVEVANSGGIVSYTSANALSIQSLAIFGNASVNLSPASGTAFA